MLPVNPVTSAAVEGKSQRGKEILETVLKKYSLNNMLKLQVFKIVRREAQG